MVNLLINEEKNQRAFVIVNGARYSRNLWSFIRGIIVLIRTIIGVVIMSALHQVRMRVYTVSQLFFVKVNILPNMLRYIKK